MGPYVPRTVFYHYFGGPDNRVCIDQDIDPTLYKSPVCKSPAGVLGCFFARAADDRLESTRSKSTFKDNQILLTYNCKEEKYLFALQRQDGKWDVFKDTYTEKYFESGRLSGKDRCIEKFYDEDYSVPKEVALKIIGDFTQRVTDNRLNQERQAAAQEAERKRAAAEHQSLYRRFFG